LIGGGFVGGITWNPIDTAGDLFVEISLHI
jgi:hypothetical protein